MYARRELDLNDIPSRARNTPWGQADRAVLYSEGIIEVTTPGHGGFYLFQGRLEQLLEKFPGWAPFGGVLNCWFEEDCDACAVVLAFPEVFHAIAVWTAVRHVRAMTTWSEPDNKWARILAVAERDPAIIRAVEDAERETAGKWERSGSSGGHLGGEWREYSVVHYYRNGQSRAVLEPWSAPLRRFVTDDELSALTEYNHEIHDRKRQPQAV